jgi:predicted alpha/beta-fold hydrolase
MYTNIKPKGIIVIVPGFMGSEKALYSRNIMTEAKSRGYLSVVINHRGAENTPLVVGENGKIKTHFDDGFNDVEQALKFIYKNYGKKY